MKEYRYNLDKSSKKHFCPQCKMKRFVRYIDKVTNEYLPSIYGRCDRANNCSYSLNPYTNGYCKGEPIRIIKVVRPRQKPVHFDAEALNDTFIDYQNNIFIQNLLHNIPYPFDAGDVSRVIEQYRLGTVGTAIALPFIDEDNNIRAVQVKNFNDNNNTIETNFLHSILKRNNNSPKWLDKYIAYGKQNKFVDCLFGAHLLKKYPNNPVALVEAPKTAIYGALYFGLPDRPNKPLWLGVYSRDSFTIDKVRALQGRNVTVFPDLSNDGATFDLWERKSKEYEEVLPGTTFRCSTLLESIATDVDKAKGNDIADFLINLDWREFRN